jgi:hypothetical protein
MERLDGLINAEAGPLGRDLEQDAARLTQIQRAQVRAVDHRRRSKAGLCRAFLHLALDHVGRDPKGDGVHRTSPIPPTRGIMH